MAEDRNVALARLLDDSVAQGRMQRIKAEMRQSGGLVNQARTHVVSAQSLAQSDPTLAISSLHSAVRKSLDAHARAAGYRFTSAPGAHRLATEYGELAVGEITTDDTAEANSLRELRHQADYDAIPDGRFQPAMIEHYAEVANRIISAVAADLARTRR